MVVRQASKASTAPAETTALATTQVQDNVKSIAEGRWTREQIELIKRTVAKGATDDELAMFLYLAQRYGLDPFLKEIWCIKRAKKDEHGRYIYDDAPAVIMTSRDGYLKIAQQDPAFDGLQAFVVREGDTFEIDAENWRVTHKFGTKRGKILGAWASAHRKDRKPAITFVDFSEYNDGRSNTWQRYPSAMIQKVAEAFVLKRQFGIAGLVTQEEMGAGFEASVLTAEQTVHAEFTVKDEPKPLPPASQPDKVQAARQKAVEAAIRLGNRLGLTPDEIKQVLSESTPFADPAAAVEGGISRDQVEVWRDQMQLHADQKARASGTAPVVDTDELANIDIDDIDEEARP